MLGKKLRCPKCSQVFRALAAEPEQPGFANLDFDDAPKRLDAWAEAESVTAPAPIWAAPVREVPV